MPRPPDPELEARVLKAAQKLWTAGGQKSLTMRAVAKAAGTNTPAVYRRFKDRRALLRALLQQHQTALAGLIRGCNTLQEVCHCLLTYALDHPREYELIASRIVITSHKPRPNFEYVVQKAGEWLGGKPEQYRPLIIALWSQVHGTAMLLINDVIPEHRPKVLAAFSIAVDELVRNRRALCKKALALGVKRRFGVCGRTLLPSLRGFASSHMYPTACAVGCILAPLRGWG